MKLLSGKDWDFRRELLLLGNELFKEAFSMHTVSSSEQKYNNTTLQCFAKELHQQRRRRGPFGALRALAQPRALRALDFMQKSGFTVANFAFREYGVVGYLLGLVHKKKFTPTQRVLNALQHTEAPKAPSGAKIAKTSKNRLQLEHAVQRYLQPILKQAIQFYQTHHHAPPSGPWLYSVFFMCPPLRGPCFVSLRQAD